MKTHLEQTAERLYYHLQEAERFALELTALEWNTTQLSSHGNPKGKWLHRYIQSLRGAQQDLQRLHGKGVFTMLRGT